MTYNIVKVSLDLTLRTRINRSHDSYTDIECKQATRSPEPPDTYIACRTEFVRKDDIMTLLYPVLSFHVPKVVSFYADRQKEAEPLTDWTEFQSITSMRKQFRRSHADSLSDELSNRMNNDEFRFELRQEDHRRPVWRRPCHLDNRLKYSPINKNYGGAQGLGAAICIELLKQGYKVCVADIQEYKGKHFVHQQEEEFGSENVIFSACDVTKESDYIRHGSGECGQHSCPPENRRVCRKGPVQHKFDVDVSGDSRVQWSTH
ncbi:15-hydroxyprostaglandin dehydrogenase [Trichonephila clavipes]|nr:15-hydroxyprostaglandin dehydrogenase [Trichonephila clavipes]